jgi:hypothetical protein
VTREKKPATKEPGSCHGCRGWPMLDAIPIAAGEVQRQLTSDAYSCTEAIAVGSVSEFPLARSIRNNRDC